MVIKVMGTPKHQEHYPEQKVPQNNAQFGSIESHLMRLHGQEILVLLWSSGGQLYKATINMITDSSSIADLSLLESATDQYTRMPCFTLS